MKKLIALIVSLTTVMSMAATVFAANELNTTNGSKEITVDYTVNEGYTIVIPSDLTLVEEDSAAAQLVSAKDVRVNAGEKLTVTMTSANYDVTNNNYRVVYDGNSYIKYEVKQGESANAVDEAITTNGTVLLDIDAGTTSQTKYLKFFTTQEYVEEATKAGKHEDKLTFVCEVK